MPWAQPKNTNNNNNDNNNNKNNVDNENNNNNHNNNDNKNVNIQHLLITLPVCLLSPDFYFDVSLCHFSVLLSAGAASNCNTANWALPFDFSDVSSSHGRFANPSAGVRGVPA